MHDDRPCDLVDLTAVLLVFLVSVVATVSLALAYVGQHHLWLVLPLSAALVGGVVVVFRAHLVALPRVRWAKGAWLVLPALAAAVVLSFPGFHYATGDKDPGIYVMHANSIAETGDLYIHATDLQRAGVFTSQDLPGTQWRGFEPQNADGTITPSFYHLWPALLANAIEAFGIRALGVALPMLGVLSVLLMFALTRRFAPPWVAGVAALVLATNMMQVWQARYPTTEMLGQVLYLGAALAIALALQTRVLPFALLSGTLITVGFLNRGEGVLIVMLGLLAAAAAVACDLRRRTAWWFAIGILVPLPFAWVQAYKVALRYTQANTVPGSKILLVSIAVSAVVAVAGTFSPIPARWWVAGTSRIGTDRASFLIRVVLSALFVGLFVLAGIRPWFGEVTGVRADQIIRTFDERNLHRLALYFGWPALAMFLVGLLWCVWAKWSAARSVVVALGMAFTVLFLYRAKNSPQMMWWGRRFIPVVVPTMVLLMALALCAALAVPKWRRQMVALTALVLLSTVAFQGRQSWELRPHDEKGGSHGVAMAVAAVSGDQQGVFLWQNGPCCGAPVLLFGSPTWIFGGVDSARLPREVGEWAAFLPPVVAAAGDRPVYLVLNGEGQVPADLPYVVTQSARITGALPVWEESNIVRPSKAIAYPYDLVIYKIEP